MSEAIDNLSHTGLIEATEINYRSAMIYLCHLINSTMYHDVDAIWFVDEHVGYYSAVSTLLLTANTPEHKIDEVLQRIRTSSELPIEYNVNPSMRTAKLENRLLATGWLKVGAVPALVLDVHHLDAHQEKIPTGLTIEHIDNDVAFKQYANIMATGFEFPEAAVNYIFDTYRSRNGVDQ